MLGYNTRLNKFKIKSMLHMYPDHSRMQLEINKRRKWTNYKYVEIKQQTVCNQRVKEKIIHQKKI